MDENLPAGAADAARTDRLPAPGADEPEALRQDIADEIADHLLCAARREHLQNSGNGPLTDQAALAAAVERFGEPAAIARRLWWDAMKERIMAQRMVTIMSTTVALAAVFACFVLWQSTQASRAEQTALLQSQQSVMSAMLAELKSTQKSDGAQWQTFKIRLIDEQGRPVIGKVDCTGQDNQTSDSSEAKSDGVAEFYLPPGQYVVSVTVGPIMTTLTQLLPPGRPTTRTVVCASSDVKTAPLRFEIDQATAPTDLNIYYIAQVQMTSRNVGGQFWTSTPFASISGERLLINPQGKVLGQLPNLPTPGITVNSPTVSPNKAVFPKRLPAGATLTAPIELPPGGYLVNLAPYVPDSPAAGSAEVAGAADAVPALRSVWAPGAATQILIDTQAKDFATIVLDERVFDWKLLRIQIASGTPEAAQPGYPPAYQPPSYAAPPATSEPQSPPYSTPVPYGTPYQPPSAGNPQAPSSVPPAIVPPAAEEGIYPKPRVIPLGPAVEVEPRVVLPAETP